MFDQLEDATEPWAPCHSGWCAGRAKHMSCSLINVKMPHTYTRGGGIVLGAKDEQPGNPANLQKEPLPDEQDQDTTSDSDEELWMNEISKDKQFKAVLGPPPKFADFYKVHSFTAFLDAKHLVKGPPQYSSTSDDGLGARWRLRFFPQGLKPDQKHLSVYLCLVGVGNLSLSKCPVGVRRKACFQITLRHCTNPKEDI